MPHAGALLPQLQNCTEVSAEFEPNMRQAPQWQVLEERAGGAATARHVWSPVYVDAMVLRDRDTDANGSLDERLWPQQDANWNVTALVDGSGAVIERYAYDPFGARVVLDANWAADVDGASDVGWEYLHQGLRYESVTGLYDNFNRWFSPSLGRFVSMDPIRYAAGDVNLYRYVGNGPTGRLDPSGLCEDDPLTTGPYGWFGEFGLWWWGNADNSKPNYRSNPNSAGALAGKGMPGTGVDSTWLGFQGVDRGKAVEAQRQDATAAANACYVKGPLLMAGTMVVIGGLRMMVVFGNNNPNGIYHAFRHADQAGLDRTAVQSAINSDLSTVTNPVAGQLIIRSVNVGGKTVTYNAMPLANGTINVGRITVN